MLSLLQGKRSAGLAGMVEHLDLGITENTSVALLAAVLDKPVCVLSRVGGCWRWLRASRRARMSASPDVGLTALVSVPKELSGTARHRWCPRRTRGNRCLARGAV